MSHHAVLQIPSTRHSAKQGTSVDVRVTIEGGSRHDVALAKARVELLLDKVRAALA